MEEINKLETIVEAQGRHLETIVQVIDHLSSAIDEKPSKSETRRFSLLVNFVTVFVVGVLLVFSINSTAANRTSINESKKVLEKIEDCLTPKGTCYTQQEARTGQAVGSIVQGTACKIEVEIQRAYQTAHLPPYQLSPECQ